MMVIVEAADRFKETFGDEVKELSAGVVAAEIRGAAERHEDDLQAALGTLRTKALPGADVLGTRSTRSRPSAGEPKRTPSRRSMRRTGQSATRSCGRRTCRRR